MHPGDIDGHRLRSGSFQCLVHIYICTSDEADAFILARKKDFGIWAIPICIPDGLIVIDTCVNNVINLIGV
jgi:hypothetical protein